MEAMKAIMGRRSIRKYTAQAVPEVMVKEILEAAMSAPSARNLQPWHFVVINERKVLDDIPKFHPYAGMIKEAPMAILVCGDSNLEPDEKYLAVNCSAATENLLLAVYAKGLGAVWLGIYPRPERIDGIRKLLNLPSNIVPISLMPVGYPAEHKPPENRYDPIRVHYNKWDVK